MEDEAIEHSFLQSLHIANVHEHRSIEGSGTWGENAVIEYLDGIITGKFNISCLLKVNIAIEKKVEEYSPIYLSDYSLATKIMHEITILFRRRYRLVVGLKRKSEIGTV